MATRAYFAGLPWLTGPLSLIARQRLYNIVRSVAWPPVTLPARRVTVGSRTEVVLHPHPGEFDLQAALGRELTYEREVFGFLETRMPSYEAVIEIGANVGVFTVFFAHWLGRRTPAGSVYAFEPSRLAYERLLQNLAANGSANVVAFNCAVGDATAILPFFEPAGHLTNGSLLPGFARKFNEAMSSLPVLVIDGALINQLVAPGLSVLLKIDVEGTEARVLRSLEPFIRVRRPDIVVEVLPEFEGELNKLGFLREASYQFLNLTPAGPVLHEDLEGTPYRDYFLTTSWGPGGLRQSLSGKGALGPSQLMEEARSKVRRRRT